MRIKLALTAALALAALGAVETPQAWPMPNGDTCYTYFASLSCTESDTLVSPTPTLAPTLETATATPTASPSPTRTPTPTPYSTETPLPSITPTPIKASVVNGDFENGLAWWTQYTLAGSAAINSERISTGADALAVHSGDASARLLARYACYRSGVYQVVGVPVNARVRVTAWVMTLGTRQDGLHHPEPNMNSYASIGIDPKGLTSAAVSRIEWSRIVAGRLVGATHGLDPSWQLLEIETITTQPTMTIFVDVDLGKTQDGACMWAYYGLLGFVDDVRVDVLP